MVALESDHGGWNEEDGGMGRDERTLKTGTNEIRKLISKFEKNKRDGNLRKQNPKDIAEETITVQRVFSCLTDSFQETVLSCVTCTVFSFNC